jgi:hypothetical protein
MTPGNRPTKHIGGRRNGATTGTTQAMDRPSIHLRLPRDLHDELRSRAEEQGVSPNTLLTTLLGGAIGWSLDPNAKQESWSWLPPN